MIRHDRGRREQQDDPHGVRKRRASAQHQPPPSPETASPLRPPRCATGGGAAPFAAPSFLLCRPSFPAVRGFARGAHGANPRTFCCRACPAAWRAWADGHSHVTKLCLPASRPSRPARPRGEPGRVACAGGAARVAVPAGAGGLAGQLRQPHAQPPTVPPPDAHARPPPSRRQQRVCYSRRPAGTLEVRPSLDGSGAPGARSRSPHRSSRVKS